MCKSKIRNIQFLPISDEGFQQFRAELINKNRHQKSDGARTCPSSYNANDTRVALTLERFVRNSIGHSDRERILSYEVCYDDQWHQRYLECDYVRHLPYGGGLVIGEIKSSETNSSFRVGCGQLMRICALLKDKYDIKELKFQLHFVEYTGTRTSHTHTHKGIDIDIMYHPLNKLLEFADSKGYAYDETMIWETRKKVLENMKNEKRVDNEKFARRMAKSEGISNFGFLLNQALCSSSVA